MHLYSMYINLYSSTSNSTHKNNLKIIQIGF